MEGLQLSNIPVDILLNILNIVLLFLIVRKLAYKPIRQFMDARTARVNAAAEEAQKKADAADEARAQYEEKLRDGEAECAALREDAHRQAQSDAEKIVAQARAEAEEILAEARAEAKREHDEMLGSMRREVVDLAFGISEKLLAHSVRDADTERMADRLFDGMTDGEDAS